MTPHDDNGHRVRGSAEPLPGKCGAKLRRTDPPRYCAQLPIRGAKRCRLHGGPSASGIDSGTFKHGRYSKAMGKLRGRFTEAIEDPALLDMRRPIAVQDVIVTKAAERVEENDSPEFRRTAQSVHAEAVEAFKVGDVDAAWSALSNLGALLRRGVAEDRALQNLSDQAQRLAIEQRDAWGVALSAKAAFSADEFRMLLLSTLHGLKEAGIPEATAWRAMAHADRLVTGGRMGFASKLDAPVEEDAAADGDADRQ